MTRHELIELKLKEALSPEVLDVINESGNHSVPKGSETHFKVVVVASVFEGKGRLERHRMVHDALKDLLAHGVHALSVTSRTPAEWATSEGSLVPNSPPCLGGSKAE